MYVVREIMFCKPGKVRPLVDKFLTVAKLGQTQGFGSMRVMTDISAERYWTVVAEFEIDSMDAFMSMMKNMDDNEMEELMKGYHDLVDNGKREIYNVEA